MVVSPVTVQPTTFAASDRIPLLLSAIDLPAVMTSIDGCDPIPRFSSGGGGGTVPWPTPVGTTGGDTEKSEIELAVFNEIANRVIIDLAVWTNQVALDSKVIESFEDVRELGWVLATSVGPMCEAMALAPWPEKYESETAPVANLLIDVSVFGREMVSIEQSDAAKNYFLQIQSLVARAQELENTFDDLQLSPVTTGSESIDFYVAIPPG